MQTENHRSHGISQKSCILRTSMQQRTACVRCYNDRGHASRTKASQPQQWLIAVWSTHRWSTYRHRAATNFLTGALHTLCMRKTPRLCCARYQYFRMDARTIFRFCQKYHRVCSSLYSLLQGCSPAIIRTELFLAVYAALQAAY